jgi:hypothetical protein
MNTSGDDAGARIGYEGQRFRSHRGDGGWTRRRVKRNRASCGSRFDRRLKLDPDVLTDPRTAEDYLVDMERAAHLRNVG